MKYSAALRRVAPILAELAYGGALLRELAAWEVLLETDPAGWATAEAVYYVGEHYHGGQGCPLYRALCATGFEPGASWRRPERHSAESIVTAAVLRIVSNGERQR